MAQSILLIQTIDGKTLLAEYVSENKTKTCVYIKNPLILETISDNQIGKKLMLTRYTQYAESHIIDILHQHIVMLTKANAAMASYYKNSVTYHEIFIDTQIDRNIKNTDAVLSKAIDLDNIVFETQVMSKCNMYDDTALKSTTKH